MKLNVNIYLIITFDVYLKLIKVDKQPTESLYHNLFKYIEVSLRYESSCH